MNKRTWIVSLVGSVVLMAVVAAAVTVQGGAAASQDETTEHLALVMALNQARETCYSAPECPNLEEVMALFSADARRTEIQRNNNVVLLEGQEALRDDSLRVARSFTGRRLETTAMMEQGRNVIVLQLNWDPGAAEPNPFTHVFRVEEGKVTHWVLVAP